MNTLDLDTLTKVTEQLLKLREAAQEILPLIEAIKQLDGKAILPMPVDRLIRTGEAAEILGVSQTTIGQFVRDGLLKPCYVNSEQRRFKLSEVTALISEQPLIRRKLA